MIFPLKYNVATNYTRLNDDWLPITFAIMKIYLQPKKSKQSELQ